MKRLPTRKRDALTKLANDAGTDKGDTSLNGHGYTRVYSAYFQEVRQQPLRLLEIGLCHPHSPLWKASNPVDEKGDIHDGGWKSERAPSLEMWLSYFPHAEIVGFDINDFSDIELPARAKIIRGDAGSTADLTDLARQGPFDIIIDDGSHASIHQQLALGMLWPSLSIGGLYFIEDLHWQPASLEDEAIPKTRDILRRFEITGRLDTPLLDRASLGRIEAEAVDVALFDSLERSEYHDGLHGATRDALAVLRRGDKASSHQGVAGEIDLARQRQTPTHRAGRGPATIHFSAEAGAVFEPSTTRFASGLIIHEACHEMSRRAAMLIGKWAIGQDSDGTGKRDFFAYNPAKMVSQLRLPEDGGLEVDGVSIAGPGGELTIQLAPVGELGPAAPPGRLRLVADRQFRLAVSDGHKWRWSDGDAVE